MTDEPAWPARFVVPTGKIVDYLMASAHPRGGSKARFFADRGFDRSRPAELAAALLTTATPVNLLRREESPYGPRLVFSGLIETPTGTARVRTVWLIDGGAETAALVTAIPA